MKKQLLATISVLGILSSNLSFGSSNSFSDEWNPKKSVTPALEDTINISHVDPRKELIGKSGPSPSNQALVIISTQKGLYILMCKDYDLRQLENGDYRPTCGALKASFGYGLPKNHIFQNSFEAIIRGPANIALYNLFDTISTDTIKTINHVYSEGGSEWGPAVTIPVFITGNNSSKMNFDEAENIVAKLNQTANSVYAGKKEGDMMTGRFRDFILISLEKLLKTGNEKPAVLDSSKLETIEVDGQVVKLWDESQMRKNLLPHISAFVDQYYQK